MATETYKGKPCKYGHTSGIRYVKGGGCVECVVERNRLNKTDPDRRKKMLEANRKYYETNRQDLLGKSKQYREEHKEEAAAAQKAWRETNREEWLAKRRNERVTDGGIKTQTNWHQGPGKTQGVGV